MKRAFSLVILAVMLGVCVAERTQMRRRILQEYDEEACLAAPTDKLEVPGGFKILELLGEGNIQYFCLENGTIRERHGEGYANVRSPDGVWTGLFEYPVTGPFMGAPTWNVTNSVTGETRVIFGSAPNQVRLPSPDGDAMPWTRRVMYGDDSSFDRIATAADIESGAPTLPRWDNQTFVPAGPKTNYVIRTETKSGERPVAGTPCLGAGGDYWVPFTARYEFISCFDWLIPFADSLPIVPTVAPAAAPSPAPASPLPSPVLPSPLPPPVAVVPTVAPVVPVTTQAAPPPSGAIHSTAAVAMGVLVVIAAVAL